MNQFTYKQEQIPKALLCSVCFNISSNPVFEKKTEAMMCLKHINQENQFERASRESKLFANLYQQSKIICRKCGKTKSYQFFNRHYQKCIQRRKDCKNLDLIIKQNYQIKQDMINSQCNICEKFTIKLKYCNTCDKIKCQSCSKFKQNDECRIVSLNLNQKQKMEEFQLQCKNSKCGKIINIRNAVQHYYDCNYRIKECRLKDCSWQGCRIDYKNHKCLKDLERLHQIENANNVNSISNYNKIKFINKQCIKTEQRIRKLLIQQKQMEEQ